MLGAFAAILLALCAASVDAQGGSPQAGNAHASPIAPTEPPPTRQDRPLGIPEIERRAIGPAANQPAPVEKSWVSSTAIPLVLVIALIMGGAWAVRRLARAQGGIASAIGAGGRAPAGVLSVLARYPVGGGVTLVLIQLDRRVLLVAHSPGSPLRGRPGSMSTLCEVAEPDDVASILVRTQDERGESLTRRFNAALSRMIGADSVETLEIDDPIDDASHAGSAAQPFARDPAGHQADPLRERLARMRRRDAEPAGSTR